MAKVSAGILLVRLDEDEPRFLLVHPGGPFWQRKDEGAWSIPKGEYEPGDDPEATAKREFEEELGVPCPEGPTLPLGEVRQKAGKVVTAWCVVGSIDADDITSNTFVMEWPPKSGTMAEFPEVDRAGFFTAAEAEVKLLPGQRPLIARALAALSE